MNTRELTAIASLGFAAIALFFNTLLRSFTKARRIKPPHRGLILVFRLWFGALALASLYLTVHSQINR